MGAGLVIGAGLFGACSLTTATGFQECSADSQCSNDKACIEQYCIAMPAGCRRAAGDFSNGQRIAFAALLPLSDQFDGGNTDESEVQNLNALSLAIDEGNQRDGIKGRPFALYVCNTLDDDSTLKSQADWVSTQLQVPAVVVSGSAATISAANVVTPHRVMVISANSTAPELIGTYQSDDHLGWRVAPPDTLQARVMSDLFAPQADAGTLTKLGILYVDSAYGQGLEGALRDRLPATITAKDVPYTRDGDPTDAVNTLASFAPNLTVLIGFPPDVLSIVEHAEQTATLTKAKGHRWFFSDSAKDPAILSATILPEIDLADGTAPAQGAGAHFPDFRDRFESKFGGTDPSDYSYTSHSYDAMYLLMMATAYATRNGTDPTGAAMAEGMTQMSSGQPIVLSPDNFSLGVSALQMGASINVEGSSSALDFDSDTGCPTAASSAYELWQVRDAGFTTVKLLAPSGS